MSDRQRRKARQRERQEQQIPLPGNESEIPNGLTAPKGLLIATEDPTAWLVFADPDLPMDMDFGVFQDFPLMADAQAHHVGRLVEQAATSANLGLKVAEGVLRARGLVQLHPQTVSALSAGARTLQHGGWNIGTLAGPGGKFFATVKWLPPSAAVTALSIASTAGAAVALLALQAQLNRIERLAERALETATEILAEIRADQRNEIVEIARTVHEAMVRAQAAGAVTESIWDDIGGQRIPIDLGRLTADALRRLRRCRSDLQAVKNAKERQEWFEAHGAQMSTDVTTVATGFVSSCRYEAMRLARASRKYAGDEAEEAAIRIAHEQARDKLISMRDTLEPIVAGLWKHLSLLAECPGARGWNFRGVEAARFDVTESTKRLRGSMSDIYQGITGSTLKEPEPQEGLAKPFDSLRWLLDDDESVKLCGNDDMAVFGRKVLVATTRRVFVVQESEFPKTGLVRSEVPVDAFRITLKEEKESWTVNIWDARSGNDNLPKHSVSFNRNRHSKEKVQAACDALRDAIRTRRELSTRIDVATGAKGGD
jgi:hypothetical protein